MMPEPIREHIKKVQTTLDTLMDKPAADAHADLFIVERQLAALRDVLILLLRENRAVEVNRPLLQKTNAILSLIVGCEYPKGSVQWGLLTEAQKALAAMTQGDQDHTAVG